MKNYDMIIFDLDGTLSNSKEGITKSVQYALKKMGIIEDNLENLVHHIGPPMKDEMLRCYGFSDEQATQATDYYRERYVPIGLYESDIYPGVEEMLVKLKKSGKYLAIATSKPQNMAEEVLKYLNIYEFFDTVMGAQLNGPRQSKAAVLEALFEKIQIKDRNKAILIGDTCFDVDGAKTVGIDCIGVSYGFGNTQEMLGHGAIAVVNNTKELVLQPLLFYNV